MNGARAATEKLDNPRSVEAPYARPALLSFRLIIPGFRLKMLKSEVPTASSRNSR